MIWQGGCQCGSIRYQLASDPVVVYTCHCFACQRQSSSAFGISVWVESGNFLLMAGTLSQWSTVADSGRAKTCTFCSECGSRIYHTAPGCDDMYSVKGGSLDNAQRLRPGAHIWVRSAQPWIRSMLDGLPCYATEPDDFKEIIERYQRSGV